jgi:hypothetical protein
MDCYGGGEMKKLEEAVRLIRFHQCEARVHPYCWVRLFEAAQEVVDGLGTIRKLFGI